MVERGDRYKKIQILWGGNKVLGTGNRGMSKTYLPKYFEWMEKL